MFGLRDPIRKGLEVVMKREDGDMLGGSMRKEGKEKKMAYPDVKVEVLICYRFDVEAYCRYCCDYFADLHPLVSGLSLYLIIPYHIMP